jgi:hypothetical protein
MKDSPLFDWRRLVASRKSINKRKYPSVTKGDKWFTGYEGDYLSQEDIDKHYPDGYHGYHKICVESPEHVTKVLKLKPSHTRRGRSAANIVCIDKDGYVYLMSMKSIDNFLQSLVSGNITIKDGFFEAEFCQVKQGQNYFIDLVED